MALLQAIKLKLDTFNWNLDKQFINFAHYFSTFHEFYLHKNLLDIDWKFFAQI
jgi:hypothetical protein